ncbi:MAG: PD40 domain-containing protein [Thermoguttaceae bacterium]|nr:PD40 domain-containing protein [Thermoguttaceae bacterium]
MKHMRLRRATSVAAFLAFLFCSFAIAQDEPTAGFRAKIEADWERQEATRDRSVADVDALRDLIVRSNELIERLESDKLVENSKLDVFRAAVANADSFLESDPSRDDPNARADAYRSLRWAARDAIFANELLKDSPVVFEKANRFGFQILQEYLSFYERFSNQHGGGLFRLEKPGFSFKTTELSADFPRGLFATPSLSYDAKTLYFAFADFSKVQDPDPDAPVLNAYHLRAQGDATERVRQYLTESEGKYCLYSMNLETGESTKLTDGPYDDFDPTLLPDGSLAFVSTRRGGFARCNQSWEPIMVATLHKLTPDGQIRSLSWHETNEWTPAVLDDGRIVYTRWDYVDRRASRYQGLWLTNPDGTGAVALFGNYTESPVACIQPRPIPDSNKIVFTATAHHTAVGGSIVVLDPTKVKYDPETGWDSPDSIERITPEIPFPETKNEETGEWYLPDQYYYGPTPLSEDFFLVSYSFEPANGYLTTDGNLTPETVGSGKLGLYYRDRFGNLELMYEDEKYSCRYPLILRERETIPAKIPSLLPDESASNADVADDGATGTFTLFDVKESLWPFPNDRKIKELRVFQLLPKFPTHQGHYPAIGHDFAGNARIYLGSVPVEEDGSAYFTAPARKPLYFQAVDEDGRAVQTMLSEVYLQPGENRGCVGCHEQQQTTFANSEQRVAAALRAPSALKPGPEDSKPFSYPRLVQPILDRNCVECHSGKEDAPQPSLVGEPEGSFSVSYNQLKPYLRWYQWSSPSIRDVVSLPGECGADMSPLAAIIDDDVHAKAMKLSDEDRRTLYFWLDANIPFYGTYDPGEQARQRDGEAIAVQALQ